MADRKGSLKSVHQRVTARKLQPQAFSMEAKLHEERHKLECEYQQLCEPLHKKGKSIINGTVELTEDECDFPSDEGGVAEETKYQARDGKPAIGIPGFWLMAFKNSRRLAEMIQHYDEPVLKHLIDVQARPAKAPMGFVLEFHFSPNEYFNNSVLTKTYEMQFQPDEEGPLSFKGPEIVKCTGCEINWKDGKNVNVKVIEKKEPRRKPGSRPIPTETSQLDSFFNFFATTTGQGNVDEMSDDDWGQLQEDFDCAEFILRLVTHAVFYYTGAAGDESDDDNSCDGNGSDEDRS